VYGLCVCNDFDRSVRVLANGCPKLKYFVFRFTQKQNVTDIGVAHLFRSCRNLKYARIEMIPFAVINSECAKDRCFKKGQCTDNSNRKLSDLKNVAYRANNLGLFSIKGDNSITADALSTISQQFPLLEKIEFGVSVYGLSIIQTGNCP
jgi:hypothetical protein